MQEAANCRYIEMSLPADRDMMIVVRLATSGVLARSGLTLDALSELKMAVEEACICLISQMSEPGRLELRFEIGKDVMKINCRCADDCVMGVPMSSSEAEVVGCILDSMVDKADITLHDGIISNIRLTAAIPR